ncbi:MAG: galactose mutarotase [Bacteroidales bacterium]|nr:galactose mutarotase [Bacteroidales bacterium]
MNKFIISILVLLSVSCAGSRKRNEQANTVREEAFDTVINNKQVSLYTLKNTNNLTVQLTNYGARVISILTPDKNGTMADIVLGYSDIKSYLKDPIYLGCIVGRYANRINDAKFILDDKEYNLYKNNGGNTLHGGKEGLDKKIWDASQEGNTVIFSYCSPDGEEGYPGNLIIKKSYTLTENNELHIRYDAETDQSTVINLSNHTYWNLKGEGDSTILDHYILINADYYTPIDNEWIPTGELAKVAGSPFDFTSGKKIGSEINLDNEQLTNGQGYDHNWILNKDNANELSLAARLWEETTGRSIEIFTSEPGIQFYSGNFMNGSVSGKSGKPYVYRSGLALETQHFPDSPNHPDFPSTRLDPGESYEHLVIIKFGVMK